MEESEKEMLDCVVCGHSTEEPVVCKKCRERLKVIKKMIFMIERDDRDYAEQAVDFLRTSVMPWAWKGKGRE